MNIDEAGNVRFTRADQYGMTDRQYQRMVDWCAEHENDSRVLEWLVGNPPPSAWIGTSIEYAYMEMPGYLLWE